jgi:membrane-bound lytic murein transglycosylase B
VRAEPQAAVEARAFLERLWPAAQVRGISRTLFEQATADFLPDPDVIGLAARQPEHTKATGAYVTGLVGQTRIDTGRQLAAAHANLLEAIEAAYGVNRHILVAIWGVESAYGTEMGTRRVIRSLATLAMADARRAPFWQRELIAALRMLQDGAIAPEKLVGSWAGAVGHTQFIPSTYNARAVDFDKDGRRDVWETVADALASSANYLRASGWVAGSPWGFEVALPPGFDFAWSAPGRVRTLAEWQAAGVRAVAGRDDLPPGLPSGLPLQLVLPAGARGPAFLVTGNFRALLKYNQSASYALAVGHLADRIAGGAALATPWPADDKPLSRTEREELQALLAVWGLDTGGLDGIIGDRTRAAIRITQRTFRLDEDGHPSVELLQRLRGSAGP